MEMRLGRPQLPGTELAQAQIVVDRVVFGVQLVQLFEKRPGLRDVLFGVGRNGRKEKAVHRLHLRPGGKTEQEQGQICKQLAHIGYKNMYFL